MTIFPAIFLFYLHFLEICICVFRCYFAWRSIYYIRKMKVNNSEVECLTISLRGLIHDGESNMHIKHISRLFILLQTRLKTWTLMNILHFKWTTVGISKWCEYGSLDKLLILWLFSFSWEFFILEVACLWKFS